MPTQDEERRIELLGFFFEESSEGLEIIEANLLDLDLDDPDSEKINAVFRAIHSIKGSGGSFGLDHISQFAHHAETLLDEIRGGERSITQESLDLLLHAADCLGAMIEALRTNSEPDQAQIDSVAAQLQEMLGDSATAPPPPVGSASEREHVPSGPADWSIKFYPHRHLLRTGNEPLRILRELGSLGELKAVALTDELPTFGEINAEDCYLKWGLEIHTEDVSESEIEEVFAWVDDDCDLEIAREHSASEEASVDSAPTSVAAAAAAAAAAAETASAAPGAKSKEVDQAAGLTARGSGSIRVSTEKIDALVNMVGELVITQAMLGEVGDTVDQTHLDYLRNGLSQLARNTRELQDSVMRIRMLPVSATFNRFPRLVHDLSQKLGKEVELVLGGESTELDKNVLEKIADPLVHLIRNSLDHGLERPDERVAAGKSATGHVFLDAYHEGGNIVIEVRDDGAGLDSARIRAKAISSGLIKEDDTLSERQSFDLLFEAGFSTAAEISDVSGRGVGLDVVRRNIKELGGSIQVTSEKGVGSTFKIRLPLTLAILDGQLVRIGPETYIIPLTAIVESIQIKPELVNQIAGRAEIYRLRDEAIPIVRPSGLFGDVMDRDEIDDGLLVVVEAGGVKAGLLVDDLLGQQQVVIKSLEENYGRVEGLSGATILGNGTVALILDIGGLIDLAKKKTVRLTTRMKADNSKIVESEESETPPSEETQTTDESTDASVQSPDLEHAGPTAAQPDTQDAIKPPAEGESE